MQFQKMHVRDFLSVGTAEVPLANRGLVLIEGDNADDPSAESNGAGKSTLFEALLWCLYGVTLRGLDGDEVVRHGKKGCGVDVSFTDDTGSDWSVRRTRGPADLAVTKDGANLSAGKMADTQVIINDALGMNAETFATVVMFGQGTVRPFSSMTDKEQKAVLERLVGIEAIAEAHARARSALADARESRDRAAASLEGREAEVERTLSYIEDAQAVADRWTADRTARESRIRTALAGLGAAQSASPVSAEVRTARAALEAAQSAREGVSKRTQAARDRLTAVKTRQEAADTHYQSKKAALSYWESTPAGGECSACGQTIDAKHAAKEKTLARADLLAAQHENEKFDGEATKLHATLRGLNEEEFDAKAAEREAEKKLKLAEKALAEAEAAAKSAKRERTRLEAELAEVQAEVNVSLDTVKKHKAKLKAHRAAVEEAKAEVDKLNLDLAHIEFVTESFGNAGIKSYILDAVTPYLNDRAAYFAGLISGGTLTVEFQTQTKLKSGEMREKFAVIARNKFGADVYRGNSGGEKRKIDVAVSLALQALAAGRSKSQINLAFYDEPFDALDPTAGEYAMDLLVEESKKKDTILVISHREEFRANFPTKWKAIKQKGVTRIEV